MAQSDNNAVLVLADGTIFHGQGHGMKGTVYGELCFNTAMSGYQEIITDPSYTDQIIVFTFPHIGNVGINNEDIEDSQPAAKAIVLAAPITPPSNFRAQDSLDAWLEKHRINAISGIDTRALTISLRDGGAINAAVHYGSNDRFSTDKIKQHLRVLPTMCGRDLAADVTCDQGYAWGEGAWSLSEGYGQAEDNDQSKHIVVIDYGVKRHILRSLAARDCRVSTVPAKADFTTICKHNPDGVLLSNGPGDPAATAIHSTPVIQGLLAKKIPVFGICLGHQLLALALGLKTSKMHHGHRGANHPVKNLRTGRVEITSQNHGFIVEEQDMPENIEVTHRSLFDQSVEGLRLKDCPAFSVQHHPEASPGPHDSSYLFDQFLASLAPGSRHKDARTGA